MKKSQIYYKNIFLFASLQFCGNIEEYFSKHSKKLVVFIIQPRLKNKGNLIRLYQNGKLIKEEKITLSENIFLYYFLWQKNYLLALLKHFSPDEKIIVIGFHPLTFFGMSIQKLLRNIEFVYWVGDYFPPSKLSLRIYEKVKKFYHDRMQYTCYLGDGINKVMNGKVLNTVNRKTVMWGVKLKKMKRVINKKFFSILFVGLIKDSQGLESVFQFLKENKNYSVKIIGICSQDLYKSYTEIINRSGILKQVFFPNRFFSDEELNTVAASCQVGIALYDTTPSNPTLYTDPGKVKAYAEMGLPVIMTNVSAIAPFIKKYKSGILVSKDRDDLIQAIKNMEKNYKSFTTGLEKFTSYFFYETYYKSAFAFIEKI